MAEMQSEQQVQHNITADDTSKNAAEEDERWQWMEACEFLHCFTTHADEANKHDLSKSAAQIPHRKNAWEGNQVTRVQCMSKRIREENHSKRSVSRTMCIRGLQIACIVFDDNDAGISIRSAEWF